jgi:hypothetical protein
MRADIRGFSFGEKRELMSGIRLNLLEISGLRKAREVLIISIIMFLRKKTKILCAYCLLGTSALTVIAHDAHWRSKLTRQNTQAAPARPPAPVTPLPISLLAQSPFEEARPNRSDAGEHVATRTEPRATGKSDKHTFAAGVYFLKVAVQVNSGEGPVSFNRGTQVRFVRQQDGKLLVTHKGTDFLIEKTQVTDDRSTLPALARSSS